MKQQNLFERFRITKVDSDGSVMATESLGLIWVDADLDLRSGSDLPGHEDEMVSAPSLDHLGPDWNFGLRMVSEDTDEMIVVEEEEV